MRFFLDLLFPPQCIVCNNYAEQLNICGECWGKIAFITKPYCRICSYPFEYEEDEEAICGYCIKQKPKYDKAIAVFKYNEHSKALIHKFKYQDQLQILDFFVNLMLNMGQDVIKESHIIIPVPIHKFKLFNRGYNQAALLAMKLAANTQLEYLPEALSKKNNKTSQAGLTKEERKRNIKNSFVLNPKYAEQIQGKNILIIDDVITTGATIFECCKELKKAQPNKIFVLSLAKRI